MHHSDGCSVVERSAVVRALIPFSLPSVVAGAAAVAAAVTVTALVAAVAAVAAVVVVMITA